MFAIIKTTQKKGSDFMLFQKLFKKEKQQEQKQEQDLSITFDNLTNTYNIVVNNKFRKVKVIKAKDNEIVLKTCYKTCGRPKQEKEL